MTPTAIKSIVAFFVVFTSTSVFAQQSTYSVAEERMLTYVNNQYAYALKYDSLKMIPQRWIRADVSLRSTAVIRRGAVFSYMFEMSSVITSDTTKLFPLLDSVLIYDQLPVTKLGMAEILIERNIDRKRGRELLQDAYHTFRSLITGLRPICSWRDLRSRMQSRCCHRFFEKALLEDSTRAEGWYEYGSY